MSAESFVHIFLEEAVEMLERWESACLRLERDVAPETLDELFRSAHNLKGSAKSVDMVSFGNVVHLAEDLITKLKSGAVAVSTDVIGALLDCQQFLVSWIHSAKDDPSFVGDSSELAPRLLALQGGKKEAATNTDSGFGFFDEEPIAPSKTNDLGSILIDSGKVTQLQVEKAVAMQHKKIGEILVDQGAVSKQDVDAAVVQQQKSGHKADETLRVSLKKLDAMIRLIGELSIQHSIIRNAKETGNLASIASSDAVALAHKVIQDLQSEAMGLRMQPLEGLFQRMDRVARDVARSQGKQIHVITRGIEVELDKTVIERMKDPLVHILRNAVDHGIETVEGRKESNKSEKATVVIEGMQTASHVCIKIIDDGRGLNRKKILSKAVEKGLIPAGKTLPDHEVDQLIFHPGFSTADKVTDVSGRGVGMDVVKKAVDELGGQINIKSTEGKGTEFLISLPSTLSIVDAVVVGLGPVRYAVPVQDVHEVVDMGSVRVETCTNKGRILNLHGQVIPVESLHDYLPSKHRIAENDVGVALITRNEHGYVAFRVDRVEGQQSIVIRQLEENLAKVPGFAGATILANGEPSMILHLPQIVKSYLSAVA
jgi:two-component system chemotaxis sensor kinase CheA